MKNNKLNIDRSKISPEEIAGRKDFDRVMESYKKVSKPFYKTTWFLSGVLAVCIGAASLFVFSKKEDVQLEGMPQTIVVETLIKQKETPFVNPPLKEINVNYEKYTVDGEKGGVFTYKTGSKILISKNAFLDKEGKTVKGQVEIRYREFHDAVDFFVSGIPMAYDSAGVKYQLESAGMVEILGFQNGEPVRIAQHKGIEIQMTSQYEGGQYNLYVLDTINKNWSYKGKDKIVFQKKAVMTESIQMNERGGDYLDEEEFPGVWNSKTLNEIKLIQTQIKEIEKEKPVKPKKVVEERYRFNIDVDPKEFPEIYEYKGLLFEVGPENKTFNSGMYRNQWDDVEMKAGSPGVNYHLTFTQRGKSQTFTVYPVYEGKDSAAIMKLYSHKFNTYQAKLAKRQKEEKQKEEAYAMALKKRKEEMVANQKKWEEENRRLSEAINYGNVRRIFAIDNFGIWNSDCPKRYANEISLQAGFVDINNKPLSIDIAYQIDKKKNTLFCNYIYNKGCQVRYDVKGRNIIFAVLPDQKLGICDEHDFLKINLKSGNYNFVMKETDKSFKTVDELKTFILLD